MQSQAHKLFSKIDSKFSPIAELSAIRDDKDNERKTQSIKLANQHEIDIAIAYQIVDERIVDERITLEEALKRKRSKQRQ